MKPGTPPLQSTRLLDQVRERIRYMHYSLSTEQVYLYWVRFFIRWSGRSGEMQHPRGHRKKPAKIIGRPVPPYAAFNPAPLKFTINTGCNQR